MFENPATISSNSPHLRKSGSKSVFLDPSVNGVLGGVSEMGDMKGSSSPLHITTMVPSPIFLWRFKVVLFLFWALCCCKIGWDSVMRMSIDLRDLFLYEAFLYYNPLLLVTMMVWLWGVNLWVFSQGSVNYAKVFDLDHNHLTHREMWKVFNFSLSAFLGFFDMKIATIIVDTLLYLRIVLSLYLDLVVSLLCNFWLQCSMWMTIIVPTSMTAYLYLYSHGEVSLAASQPVLLYIAFALVLIFPFDIFYLSSRYFLLRTLWRIAFPLQPITFPDFFLADILTSMVKVFSDLERSVCRMVHRQVATIAWFEADAVCGSHQIAIPLVLVFPYICRLLQCLRQYKDTKEKSSLLNALKYSTAVPVIFLSALKYHVMAESWTSFYRPLWLFSSVINSLYSFYWDVTRDWDLSGFTKIFKFSRPSYISNLLYGRQWVYFWVIGSNLVLRCAWTYKLSAHLRHNYITVFTITAMEMLRRFQWVFFRVENEWNKITKSHPIGEISLEEEKLLGSTTTHDV